MSYCSLHVVNNARYVQHVLKKVEILIKNWFSISLELRMPSES